MEFLVIAILYFVPSIVAILRYHHAAFGIIILNCLLGWTVIGWIAAFALSVTKTEGAK